MTESIEHDRRQPSWADEVCGTCFYRVKGFCRLGPPQQRDELFGVPQYPKVPFETPACAMYQHDRRGAKR